MGHRKVKKIDGTGEVAHPLLHQMSAEAKPIGRLASRSVAAGP
jgi:hypothetical protein